MNRRLALAAVAVCALVLVSGCTLFGGGEIPDEQLNASPGEPYRWNETSARVTVWVEGSSFRAIYRLEGETKLTLFRRGFERNEPLDIWAVRYRYPNGTVVNGSQLEIEVSGSKTVVRVPDGNGTLAFTAGSAPKSFTLPSYVDGSYEVILPRGYRTQFFLFGHVSPGDYRRTVEDGRVHFNWAQVDGTVSIRYYLQRDFYLFVGLVGLLAAIGVGGVLYYRRQINRLERVRREHGLDVDQDDEFDDEPPPGMG